MGVEFTFDIGILPLTFKTFYNIGFAHMCSR